MPKFLVTGGRQRLLGEDIKEWKGYDKAVCILLDTDRMIAEPFFEYFSPPEHLPEDPEASITFKSASIHNEFLIACTTTEILKISIPDRKLCSIISLPVFNDVHHAYINHLENYIVTSTGLDAVFEVSDDGEIVNEWSVLDSDIWDRFDRNVDYRLVLTTKPHASHPNHCTDYEGEPWVTRSLQEEFLNLNTREVISIPFMQSHDGLVVGEEVYFTHVKGVLSKIHMPTKKVTQILDTNELHDRKEVLGWCRGIAVLNDNEFIVGYTRVRPSKSSEAFQWLKRKLITSEERYYGSLPTRLIKYDLNSNKKLWEFDLEPFEINAVFSILPVEDKLLKSHD